MKKSLMAISLILILCVMASACQDKEAMAELEAMKAQAKVEEQNIALVRRVYEELNKANLDHLKELLAPNFAYYSPSGRVKPLSLKESLEFGKMLLKAFPDSNWNIDDIFAVKDKVVVRYTYHGTHEGEFEGIPATGNKVEYSALVISIIKNGKIVDEWEDSDTLSFMQQLGMELKPKEVK